ncbi:DNA-binding response regulator, OmpR family, contains REC and winged-helix (wHTH) domain [Anaerocolumna jejuensis DSM 15929]|uniref:Stage 0 sporulation protein A homolog n=1 Tax=Anaerocolumna jejuensis DSM 15929 TaxID=1121322 RepID=A0A1M6PY02_9FIRM|nr:response regulator transcription factor [Anaerocolumna jejuensis]SHK12819.1 DNA-binding response regulator, OmpR family, contains REC and winged-helix (wHTH) domain [Anaerocolumna jejuensis DSM 15929]
MKNILVIEDDVIMNSGICYNLVLEQYNAVPVYNAAAALEKIQSQSFELVVLDVNLPDGSGFELCPKIKAVQDIPVVFLTACDLEKDVMTGYELGGDDYVTKPFQINIFCKKVAAILKRCEKKGSEAVSICGDLIIDFNRLTAVLHNEPVIFTPTEYRMLKVFTENPGILLTKQVLLEKLYDVDANFVDEHVLTVNINRLRSKIEVGGRKFIKTVYGMGYLWAGDKR